MISKWFIKKGVKGLAGNITKAMVNKLREWKPHESQTLEWEAFVRNAEKEIQEEMDRVLVKPLERM